MKLLIIGTLPEISGIGGVTIHVNRLLNSLSLKGIEGVALCDYKITGITRQVSKIKRAKAIHVHVSNPYLKLFYALICRLFNVTCMITLHGKYGVYGRFRNMIHSLSLRLCTVPILINPESFSIVKNINPRAVCLPAFIRPSIEEEMLSPNVEDLIASMKATGKVLFATNASSRAFTSNGEEVYGIDFLIAFFSKHQEYNLVILDPSGQYSAIYRDGLPENILMLTERVSFSGLVKMCDAVVRNTSTDGDSFSVKEALYFHCPVLATDVVTRPDGVCLFKYNDENSLDKSINGMLSSGVDVVLDVPEATECYLQLYRNLGIITTDSDQVV